MSPLQKKSSLNHSIDLYDHRKLWSHLDCHDSSSNLYRKGNSNRHRTKASSTTSLLIYYFPWTSFIFFLSIQTQALIWNRTENITFIKKHRQTAPARSLSVYCFFYSAVFHTYRSRNGMTFCRFYWPLSVETPRAGRTCVDYHWWV